MEDFSRRHLITAGAAAALPFAASGATKPGGTQVIERQELLAGKVAVVYGAAGSMGSAVSRAFARAGAHVELAGHTFEKVDAIARELSTDGARASAAKVDAFDRESVEKHLEGVVRTHGRVDISFNLIGLGDAQGALLASMKAADFVLPIEAAMRETSAQCLDSGREVAQQVIDGFDPDGQPQQAIDQARCRARFGRHGRVRHRGRMGDEAFDSAQ